MMAPISASDSKSQGYRIYLQEYIRPKALPIVLFYPFFPPVLLPYLVYEG
jgi:hypothetical protein